MSKSINHTIRLNQDVAGKRLDKVCAELFPDFSRSRLQGWIKSGEIRINDRQLKVNAKLSGGELLELNAEIVDVMDWQPEPIPLDILFEDEHILVLNKPYDLVVHPAAGHWQGTLLNGLLHYAPELASIPRAGIVHRLDKNTSGLMVVAKTLQAQQELVIQLQNRTVSRVYAAVVAQTGVSQTANLGRKKTGELNQSGIIDLAIGRHKTIRTKMAAFPPPNNEGAGIKEAITYYDFLNVNAPFSLVELSLKTGRTHQIRVHLSYYGFPIVGDHIYGAPSERQWVQMFARKLTSFAETTQDVVKMFSRQALHAKKLSLIHPATKKTCSWEASLPADMSCLVKALDL